MSMDGLDAIASAAKLERSEVLGIWEEVKMNHARLNTCAGPHDFSIDLSPTRTLGKKWRCSKCGGEVDHIVRDWYLKGLDHGAKR